MAKRKFKSYAQKKKEIDDLTDMRNEEVNNFFQSPEQMKEYLDFMSKFHDYSARNNVLIQKQFRGAEAVGGFNFWKDQGFSVQKGEKSIKILVPYEYKAFDREKENKTVETPLKYATKEEKEAIDRGDIEVKNKLRYRTGSVFDVSQTNATAEDLPSIFPNKWLDGEVDNYQDMYQSLEKMANQMNVNIHDEPMEELGVSKGQFVEQTKRNPNTEQMEHEKAIELNPRNSELHNVKTLVHELAHAKLHNSNTEHAQELNHSEKEFQAEMTAYTVCSHFNLDTSDYSLNYLYNYTNNHEDINDKMQLLDEVKDTSYEFITHLEQDITKKDELTDANEKTSVSEQLKEQYQDIEIVTKNGQTEKIGDLSLDEFKNHFEDEHNRNILNQPDFEGLNDQEMVQAFNNMKDKGTLQNTVMVDHSLEEPHAFVEFSESNLDQDLKPVQEMERYLAEQNIESLHGMGYDKTGINYVVPTEDGVEIKDAGRIDLGDGSFVSLHDELKEQKPELADLTSEVDVSNIYSPERMTKELASAYNYNLELNASYSADPQSVEVSNDSVNKISRFVENNGYLSSLDTRDIKASVEDRFSERQQYKNIHNDMVTLKGQYQQYQNALQQENKGELTEDKVVNRMNAESNYDSMKQDVSKKYNESNDVISKMESDAMRDYRYDHKDKDVEENPFGQSKTKVKQKEQGLSM